MEKLQKMCIRVCCMRMSCFSHAKCVLPGEGVTDPGNHVNNRSFRRFSHAGFASRALASSCVMLAIALPCSAQSSKSMNSMDSASTPKPVLANVGLASPENLVFDTRDNVYLISNMNGGPRAKDSNGFVSMVSAAGNLVTLKWIDGSNPGTRLDAPKGLAIRGDTLAIADVGCVRLFSLRTRKSLGVWKVPGVLLNDVSFAPDGTLYVTDTGPDSGKTSTMDRDAIYRFGPTGIPVAAAEGSDLSGPDGIIASDAGFVYSTFGANRVERISRSGKRTRLATLPGAKADGLRELSGGSMVVTSWDAHSVFRLAPDGRLTTIASGINSPAGVAYNPAKHQLAITSMNGNTMYLVTLK